MWISVGETSRKKVCWKTRLSVTWQLGRRCTAAIRHGKSRQTAQGNGGDAFADDLPERLPDYQGLQHASEYFPVGFSE